MPAPPLFGSLLQISGENIVGNQQVPELLALPNGRVVAAWYDSGGVISMKLLNGLGQTTNSMGLVATTGGRENSFSLGGFADGRFIIAYEDTTAQDVKARVYDSSGVAFGAPITIAAPGAQAAPAVGVQQGTGRFSIAYSDDNPAPDDVMGFGYRSDLSVADLDIFYSYFGNTLADKQPGMAVFPNGVQATAYLAGTELRMTFVSDDFAVYSTSEITVSTSVFSFIDLAPQLTVLADGNLFVGWSTSANVLKGRIYGPTGQPLGPEFDLDAGRPGYLYSVTALSSGGFAVSYSNAAVTQAYARIFDSSYQPVDVAFELFAGVGAGAQLRRSHLVEMADGRLMAASSIRNVGGDLDVVGQIYDPRVGNQILTGSSLSDDFYGTGNSDAMYMGEGADVAHGEGGADYIRGGDGQDTLHGGAATDLLFGDQLADTLFGDDGDDYLYGGLGNDTLSGGTGADVLYGEENDDTLNGDANDDVLIGAAGRDSMYGGDGADSADGGLGDDIFYGGIGADFANGGDGADTLIGEAGNDQLYGGAGVDSIDGGADADTIYGGADGDFIQGGAGGDVLIGEAGNDDINGGTEDDSIDGGAGGDTLRGGDGSDFIQGGTDSDSLFGDAGADTLNGGSESDTLTGGTGGDTMTGGTGFDAFFFAIGSGVDVITDFEDNVDKINLSGYAGATFANTIIAQSGANTVVSFAGAFADQVILVNFTATNLTAGDFVF